MLLGWGTLETVVRMQFEAEEKGLFGVVHILGACVEFVGWSSFHVHNVFLFTKSFQLMEAIPPLSNY